jgi:hypothetical protein
VFWGEERERTAVLLTRMALAVRRYRDAHQTSLKFNVKVAEKMVYCGMPGRQRLPGGEPRKASQRNARRAVSPAAKATPVWRASMPVLWKGRAGIFRRDVGDGEHAEVVIEGRIYRVRIGELQ